MTLNPKPCRYCKKSFQPKTKKHIVCSDDCAIGLYEKQKTKQLHTQARMERKALREKKQALKTRTEWAKDVQKVFNKYIVKRDECHPCISCGAYVLQTGFWSCGHFRTVGSSPHMRFVEDNAHKQCSSCNGGSEMYIKKRERVATAYESNLRLRIGDERVDAVKRDQSPRHYTIDDLKQLKAYYQAKIKARERKAG